MKPYRRGRYSLNADEALMADAAHALQALEHFYGVQVVLSLMPSDRKGVWVLLMMAQERTYATEWRQVVSYRREWPSSVPESLTGAIFTAVNQIDMLLSERAFHTATEGEQGK